MTRPPNHSASLGPGRLRCTVPIFTEPSVIDFDNEPSTDEMNGPIVSDNSRQKRTIVYSVENVRPRMSSATLSCKTVKPVMYPHPAPAPTTAHSKSAGANDDTAPVPMIAAPVVTTAAVNTACRGSRRCTPNNVTTPIAAPTPNAIMRIPNAELPPPSTSCAKSGPSGMIMPPPIRPPARPIITPRTSGFDRTNRSPSTMSCHVWATGTRLIAAPFAFCRGVSLEMRNADTRNVDASTQIGRRFGWSWKIDQVWKSPSHFETPARIANTTAPTRNVPYAATRPERVRRRELVGILHDVRHARVLGRTPEQREHLDQERQDDEAEQVVPERQDHEQREPADVARDHHDLAVPAVEERAAERREHEARQHARDHHEPDAGARARHALGDRR